MAAYGTLVLFLRISGKRTLTKLNSFDFVVTVALGSTLATIILNKDITLAEGLTALALLITLQYLIAFASVRSRKFRDLVKEEPTLLAYQGKFMDSNMRQQRITHDEVLQVARSQAVQNIKDVFAVVLETDGSISILKEQQTDSGQVLGNVDNGKMGGMELKR